MRAIALVAAVSAVLSGCVHTPPPPERDEWERVHVRHYDGISPRQVQEAAEKVLRLADKDFRFEYPQHGLLAVRSWMLYAVIAIGSGKDYWTVETQEAGGGTKVTVRITREQSTTTASPVIGGPGYAPVIGSTPGEPLYQEAPYALFWERLEYFLGKRSDWVTCDQFKDRIKGTPMWKARGQLDALCGIGTDDRTPEDGPRGQ